ncbi:MBL fold metallo-hydrolase [Pseudoalteromonas sp. MMG022]|uniref:MBL fold metallo-hydrolase RNA specificity domain-containing protein n=1 Tax=Pseudoalteromonas sp. MMG022 TaxID=2909978 RepID=UPI001F304D53|nr:MBL fold metallo-hydrolase [Pseudoalteromonas sp. MMG022]MCF6434904.1 MBL fold metallo-hydrolase [Pseudoalteromonas sp. MMG022]
MATITFYGAVQEVTGSCHVVRSATLGEVMLDCGMHQGMRAKHLISRAQFAFNPRSIDMVILSHAHLDHSGRLPSLLHDGFDGPIYCTEATAQLLPVMLFDSLSLYENDLRRENRKRARKGLSDIEAQYSKEDVLNVLDCLKPIAYKQRVPIGEGAFVCFHDAGHILGSAIVELTMTENGEQKKLVFSGDLGNTDTLLMNDPVYLEEADIVLMEGTYGDREHKSLGDTQAQLKDILHTAFARGGNVMIPAFAVGRTQELLLYLGKLQQAKELDNWQIFLDSPMAIEVTAIYDLWLPTLDCEGVKKLCTGEQTLLKNFLSTLHLMVDAEESMAINKISNGALIIAGSGMCTGGRITHHFKHRIWDSRNTIIFVGYQANGTLGRALVDGAQHIKLFGEDIIVKANIETLNGFSAHAGQAALIEWVCHFKTAPKVVLVHGEPDALAALADKLEQQHDIKADIPILGDTIEF